MTQQEITRKKNLLQEIKGLDETIKYLEENKDVKSTLEPVTITLNWTDKNKDFGVVRMIISDKKARKIIEKRIRRLTQVRKTLMVELQKIE